MEEKEYKSVEIVVLDYSTSTVYRYKDVKFPVDDDYGVVLNKTVETFLSEVLGFNMDEINYMFSDKLNWDL